MSPLIHRSLTRSAVVGAAAILGLGTLAACGSSSSSDNSGSDSAKGISAACKLDSPPTSAAQMPASTTSSLKAKGKVGVILPDTTSSTRYTLYDALIEGGQTRLRPILMTAFAAMLALVPLSLGLTEGLLIASDLGRVVIGGLFTSTLLTLLVVPVIYSFADGMKRRFHRPPKHEEPAVKQEAATV